MFVSRKIGNNTIRPAEEIQWLSSVREKSPEWHTLLAVCKWYLRFPCPPHIRVWVMC